MEQPTVDGFNFTWTVLPGVDLVAMGVAGVTTVFYVLSDEWAVVDWKPDELARWRQWSGLAFIFGEA